MRYTRKESKMESRARVVEGYLKDDKRVEIKKNKKGYHSVYINGKEQKGIIEVRLTGDRIYLDREYVDFSGRPITEKDLEQRKKQFERKLDKILK